MFRVVAYAIDYNSRKSSSGVELASAETEAEAAVLLESAYEKLLNDVLANGLKVAYHYGINDWVGEHQPIYKHTAYHTVGFSWKGKTSHYINVMIEDDRRRKH